MGFMCGNPIHDLTSVVYMNLDAGSKEVLHSYSIDEDDSFVNCRVQYLLFSKLADKGFIFVFNYFLIFSYFLLLYTLYNIYIHAYLIRII